MRLVGFFTDYQCETDSWQDAKALPLCGTCRACVNACPTGAIGNDRFLLRAERCIAYHNEMPSSKSSFPLWIPPESHNSIVGCMLCQRVCPMDREVISWAEDLCAFTEDETGYLLRGRYDGDGRLKIEKKLRKAGLDLSIFPRNLEAILR
jgi:epoxyqueuosine reductase